MTLVIPSYPYNGNFCTGNLIFLSCWNGHRFEVITYRMSIKYMYVGIVIYAEINVQKYGMNAILL